MDAGLVGEGVRADVDLSVGLWIGDIRSGSSSSRRWAVSCSVATLVVAPRNSPGSRAQGHDHLFERGVAGALAEAR